MPIRMLSVHERIMLVLWNLNKAPEVSRQLDTKLPFSSTLIEAWLDLSLVLAELDLPPTDHRIAKLRQNAPQDLSKVKPSLVHNALFPAHPDPSVTALP